MRYNSDTWSVELPQDWVAKETPECVLLYNGKHELGAFQISSFFKEDENANIEDVDLLEFIGHVKTRPVKLAYLEGVYYREQDQGYSSFYWCLRSGAELIYVAYSCETDLIDIEQEERDTILNSLRSQS